MFEIVRFIWNVESAVRYIRPIKDAYDRGDKEYVRKLLKKSKKHCKAASKIQDPRITAEMSEKLDKIIKAIRGLDIAIKLDLMTEEERKILCSLIDSFPKDIAVVGENPVDLLIRIFDIAKGRLDSPETLRLLYCDERATSVPSVLSELINNFLEEKISREDTEKELDRFTEIVTRGFRYLFLENF